MSVEAWGIVVGVAMSGVLALTPWMFMVHAKLAVIASQVKGLCDQVERSSQATQKLWEAHAEHQARLDAHQVRICYTDERLREIEAER